MKNSFMTLMDIKNRIGSEEFNKLKKLYNLDEYSNVFLKNFWKSLHLNS